MVNQIWTQKHDEAITRTFDSLLKTLEGCEDRDECQQLLMQHQWPHGPVTSMETPSAAVRKTLGNKAIVHHCKKLMDKVNPQNHVVSQQP